MIKRKSSKQRDMILAYMKTIEGHVSAEEVYKNMKEAGMDVSLATIYRNLNILTEMNEIKRIAHTVDGYQYDKTSKPHYHLHCTKCNRLFDLDMSYMEELNKKLEEEGHVKITSHSIMAEGICEECRKKMV